MFTTRNLIIAAVSVAILVGGYFLLKPSKKVEVAPAKPAATVVVPAKPVEPAKVAPVKPAEPAKK